MDVSVSIFISIDVGILFKTETESKYIVLTVLSLQRSSCRCLPIATSPNLILTQYFDVCHQYMKKVDGLKEPPRCPAIPLLGVYLKDAGQHTPKISVHVHLCTIPRSEEVQPTCMSINRWMDEENVKQLQWDLMQP